MIRLDVLASFNATQRAARKSSDPSALATVRTLDGWVREWIRRRTAQLILEDRVARTFPADGGSHNEA